MKKLLLLIILLAIPLVSAASIINTDLINNPETIRLSVKDTIRFNMFDKEHEIMLREIRGSNSVKITVFIEGAQTPIYIPLDSSNHALLDINKDRVDDLKIDLLFADKENAVLSITKLDSPQSNIISGDVVAETKENPSKLIGIIITVAVIVIGSLLYFGFKKSQ